MISGINAKRIIFLVSSLGTVYFCHHQIGALARLFEMTNLFYVAPSYWMELILQKDLDEILWEEK